MDKILVTGAGGFIGYNLCDNLAQEGFEVIGVDLYFPDENKRRYVFRKETGDFRNTDQMSSWLSGVDAVIHLASAHLQISLSPDEYWDINVRSLRPFLSLAQESGVKRFIHVSSVGVYGNLQKLPATEESPCKPQSIYGETKLAGEKEVIKYFEETGFPIVVIRPAWVYGPYCPRTLKIFRTLRKKRFLMIGDGQNLRHPLYIKDMIEAFKLCVLRESAVGNIFLVAGQEAITTNELIRGFCTVLSLPYPKVRVPYWIGSLMARGVETVFNIIDKETPISKRSLEFFDTNNAFDIVKVKNILGFNPRHSFEDGLKYSKKWLSENS